MSRFGCAMTIVALGFFLLSGPIVWLITAGLFLYLLSQVTTTMVVAAVILLAIKYLAKRGREARMRGK